MTESSVIHWTVKVESSSPSSSVMPDVSTVSVSPTWAVPPMVGAPVAGLLGWGSAATGSVAALVSVSWWPPSSTKVTRTLMALPTSSSVRV